MAHFLSSVSQVSFPLTLELTGTAGAMALHLCVHRADAPATVKQLRAHFPEVICTQDLAGLRAAWGDRDDGDERAVVEFSLAYPFMLPLALPGKADPFVGLTGAMSALEEDEAAVYQVTYEPLSDPWEVEGLVSVIRSDGKPFFDDGAELVKGAKEKGSRPLYSAVVRLAARASELERVWQIIRNMAAPLRLFSRHGGNQLTPVRNDDYDHWEHCEDLLYRRCRRTGMIVNVDELTGLIRFPTAAVRAPAFRRLDAGTRAATPAEKPRDGVCLGRNEHAGKASARLRHDELALHFHSLVQFASVIDWMR